MLDLHYHASHTDFMYKRSTTKNDNRRSYSTQQNKYTYQRTCNHDLQIQALNIIATGLQNQINNITSNSSGGGGGGSEIGVSWFNLKMYYYYYYLFYTYTIIQVWEYLYISPELVNPVPIAFFKHTPDTNINIAYKTKLGVA